jgi:hypothetical protein
MSLLRWFRSRSVLVHDLQDMAKENTQLEGALIQCRLTLRTIAEWKDFPPTDFKWDNGVPMSFGTAHGSNGERDYMRNLACTTLVNTHRLTRSKM